LQSGEHRAPVGALHHLLSGRLLVNSNTRQWLTAKYRTMMGGQTYR